MASTPPPVAGRLQLDQLTGLRGLAAWFVVLYHIRLSLTGILPGEAISVFAKGYLAVDLFFMLSGFVMWLSYADKFQRDGPRQVAPFLWKRFSRVWPLHALILCGFAGFVVVLVATGRPLDGYPLDELPLHFLLIQNWGFTPTLTWNHPAWSISTEFAAYLTFPLLVFAVPWRKLGALGLIAILAVLTLAINAWFSLWGVDNLGQNIAKTGLMRCLLEFTMGIAIARLWQVLRTVRSGAALSFGATAIIAIAGVVFDLVETLLFPAFSAALLLALALDDGVLTRILSARPFVAIGDWSYATYLAHFLLFIIFKIAFVGDDLQMGWLGLIGFCAIVLASSAILYRGFEKPAQKWLNSRQPGLLSAT